MSAAPAVRVARVHHTRTGRPPWRKRRWGWSLGQASAEEPRHVPWTLIMDTLGIGEQQEVWVEANAPERRGVRATAIKAAHRRLMRMESSWHDGFLRIVLR
jgi:hypothetical protein